MPTGLPWVCLGHYFAGDNVSRGPTTYLIYSLCKTFCWWQFPIYRLFACINILLWFSQRFITIIIIHIHGGGGKQGRRRSRRPIKREKTKCLFCSPWDKIASPLCRTSTVWTLTFMLHPVFQHLHEIYKALWILWFAIVLCSLGSQADWKERGSYQDISFSCFLTANNFGIKLCKGHGLWNALYFLWLCKLLVTSERIAVDHLSQMLDNYNNFMVPLIVKINSPPIILFGLATVCHWNPGCYFPAVFLKGMI